MLKGGGVGRCWMVVMTVLCAGAAQAAPLTEDGCSILVTTDGLKPELHDVPGLSVLELRPEAPLSFELEEGVKVNAIVCWRSEAKLADHDDMVTDAGFAFFVKTELEDASRDRTLVLERAGGSYRVRLASGPEWTDAERAEINDVLRLYEARVKERSRAAANVKEIVPSSPNAPADQSLEIYSDEMGKYEAAIAPHVAQAKKSWPDAKRRYLAGLPAGHSFFVTTHLRDSQGHSETAFVRVESIRGGLISGRIATQLQLVETHRFGDAYSFREDSLIDWTISNPDGSEEGNVVGKFLETYRP